MFEKGKKVKKIINNVVICYANEDEVINYAYQLTMQSLGERIFLTVVINKEGKGKEYLQNALVEIKIEFEILNPKNNCGYLNGLLYGFRNSKVRTEWFIFSNTDIEISSISFIENFFSETYQKNSEIWVVGPSVFAQKEKKYSNPYLLQRPSKLNYIIKNCGMRFPVIYEMLFKIKGKIKRREENSKESIYTYAVHGSFMFIRSELLCILSQNSPWELLYDEEQYIAEEVRAKRKKIFYDSRLLVTHTEGSCTEKENLKRRYKLMRKSNHRILNQYYQM